jgi:hypothetical protein
MANPELKAELDRLDKALTGHQAPFAREGRHGRPPLGLFRVTKNIVRVEKHHGVGSPLEKVGEAGTGWAFGEMEIQLSGTTCRDLTSLRDIIPKGK